MKLLLDGAEYHFSLQSERYRGEPLGTRPRAHGRRTLPRTRPVVASRRRAHPPVCGSSSLHWAPTRSTPPSHSCACRRLPRIEPQRNAWRRRSTRRVLDSPIASPGATPWGRGTVPFNRTNRPPTGRVQSRFEPNPTADSTQSGQTCRRRQPSTSESAAAGLRTPQYWYWRYIDGQRAEVAAYRSRPFTARSRR